MPVDESEIGWTPLVELDLPVAPTVYGKAEWFNLASMPMGGSVKTRIGASMLDAAATDPSFDPAQTVIEATSGNTGAAVARIGAARGHDVEVVLPDDAGRGKVTAIREAGTDVHTVDSEAGYDAFLERCRAIVAGDPERYYYPNQYENPANPAVHAGTTGPETWRQTRGAVTHFVAGAGTGGTVTGVSHALRDRGVSIHGFEPAATDHDIAGLKQIRHPETDVPETLEPGALDGRHVVTTDAAWRYARRLRERHADATLPIRHAGQWTRAAVRDHLRVDGEFLVGPSSGACVALVHRLADHGTLASDDVVVVPLPDRGDRYPASGRWGHVL